MLPNWFRAFHRLHRVTFTENAKSTGTASVKFARQMGTAPVNQSYLRASLFTGTGSSAVMADGNAVVFGRSYSDSIDGNDAIKIVNSGENFGVKSSGKLLAIDAKAPVTTSDTIFYNMTNMAKHSYQLRFAPQNMATSGMQAFLVDNYLNTSTPVSLTDSSFVNITITSNPASSAADRFKLVFKQMAALPVSLTSIKATPKNKSIVVDWNVENESGIQQYEVESSSDGINFASSATVKANNMGAGSYEWTDFAPMDGNNFYRIKSVSQDGKIIYSSIVKVVVGELTEGVSVYPNPVINGIVNLHLTNQPAGIYEVRLINSVGQIMSSRKIIRAAGNSTETFSISSSPKGIYQLEVKKPDGNISIIKVIY